MATRTEPRALNGRGSYFDRTILARMDIDMQHT